MKSVLSFLVCFLLLICMTSCAKSGDGGSSAPVGANPESDVPFSSEESVGKPETEKSSSLQTDGESDPNAESVTSDQSSLKGSSENTSSDNLSSAESEEENSDQSSSGAVSSAITASDEQSTSESDSSQTPTSDESSSQPTKTDINPIEPKNYYCYSKLNPIQKNAYDILLAEAELMPNRFIELGDANDIKSSDAYLVIIALKNDHPEIFWLPYAWYIGETHNGQLAILFVNETQDNVGGSIESITATYVVEKAKKQTMQNELKTAVEKIKSKITATTPYEIELQIHDILCEQIIYENDPNPSSLAYTAYGALVQGKAVCEGYSRAFQLLLCEFGIESTPITGYAGQEHMWNLVKISGKWYHVDATWNDQESESRHTYFNLDDSTIEKDHIFNVDFTDLTIDEVLRGEPFNYALPVCDSTTEYFYEKTGLVLPRDMEKLISGIETGNIKQIEVVGWNESVENTLRDRVKHKSISYIFDYESKWAIITVKN